MAHPHLTQARQAELIFTAFQATTMALEAGAREPGLRRAQEALSRAIDRRFAEAERRARQQRQQPA